MCDVRQKIHSHQAVKHETSIKAQIAKMERGAKRNCTEGALCDYQIHRCSKKQKEQPGQFVFARMKKTVWSYKERRTNVLMITFYL